MLTYDQRHQLDFFTCSSGIGPVENVWKGEEPSKKNLEGDSMNLTSVEFKIGQSGLLPASRADWLKSTRLPVGARGRHLLFLSQLNPGLAPPLWLQRRLIGPVILCGPAPLQGLVEAKNNFY